MSKFYNRSKLIVDNGNNNYLIIIALNNKKTNICGGYCSNIYIISTTNLGFYFIK